jgi:GNAT superfamily N-acetyltransferase/catechol 2,3-dioxygenase-like lactoylglutathione lyase family enzyme
MAAPPDELPPWRRCSVADAAILAELNARLSEDEGSSVGTPAAYLDRMQTWLAEGRYDAAIVDPDGEAIAYVVWRDDPDYEDIYVRQFFVVREHRGQGLGRQLFERAAEELWAGRVLRLDVYDSNPRGRAFWEQMGFASYSSLMRRPPTDQRRPAPARPLRAEAVVLNVTDARRAAEFWTAALGYDQDDRQPDFLLPPSGGHGVRVHLDEADRTHLDLWVDRRVSDMETEVERLVALGATRVEWAYPDDADFVVLADPDGNVFCVIS